jgi:hypothetical protein
MKYKFALIFAIMILSVATLLILKNSSSNISYSGYRLEKVNIEIDNQNISLYLLNLYGEGCYQYNITNGYFIIKNEGPGINYIIPLVEYINTTSFIFCNQTFYYNITIKECLPINPCNIKCTPGELCPMIICMEYPYCSNVIYYINITYPIIIVNDSIFLYNNNVFCYSENNCNIIYQILPKSYLYNLIYNLISSIPKNIV